MSKQVRPDNCAHQSLNVQLMWSMGSRALQHLKCPSRRVSGGITHMGSTVIHACLAGVLGVHADSVQLRKSYQEEEILVSLAER